MSTVLFWDIDGTLLATGGAGMIAWNDAVKELTGQDFDLRSSIRSSGMTDFQIGVKTLEFLGFTPAPGDLDRLVSRYEELLPASLPLKEGQVLGHVREILTVLAADRPDIRSYLLTGNTAGGAKAKLVYYGLWDLISRGAFSVDATERAGIARRALELARADGPVEAEQAIVIGDTPHDIHCANAIGARTLAVATGGYSLDELLAHQPWHGCPELPAPREFLALIDSHP
ncbi:MAG: HAD hydrolase-like protein [Vicinamibacterales bacterium]